MIAVVDHVEGCLLPVRAQPNARKAMVVGEHNGSLKLAVSAPPEDGRANKALIDLLRESLALKRGQIELIRGATTRDKLFLIRGLKPPELLQRLTHLLA